MLERQEDQGCDGKLVGMRIPGHTHTHSCATVKMEHSTMHLPRYGCPTCASQACDYSPENKRQALATLHLLLCLRNSAGSNRKIEVGVHWLELNPERLKSLSLCMWSQREVRKIDFGELRPSRFAYFGCGGAPGATTKPRAHQRKRSEC